ncbi:MAG: Uma2 family endonuclease [Armatimonadetes bacterium]|nr:Uma2 family endonuclease [Armatimonadota bacterium]
MNAADEPVSRTLSKEEFKQLPEVPPFYEFEFGEAIEMPKPHPWHNRVMGLLCAFPARFVERLGLGLVFMDVDVDLAPGLGYAPDLLFISKERAGIYDRETGEITGAPDLVVEIVSPSSGARDRFRKFNNYLAAGVEWYWIIDPNVLGVEEYHRLGEHYVRTATVAEGEVFRPGVFEGLEINLAEIVGPRL